MSQIADATHGHKNREASEARMQKAIARIPPGKGTRSLWVLYELLTYKIPSRLTGAYAHFEVESPPRSEPPLHVWYREDESFYVQEGEYEFRSGGETLRTGSGLAHLCA
jgi:mannose-6-phosphate isomerase-like protein (cupin superfamily)